MNAKVYDIKEAGIAELESAIAAGYEFAHHRNSIPQESAEYYRVFKDADGLPTMQPVEPDKVGIPRRPYDGREVFLRRPAGINLMFTADAEIALSKFYQRIWMEPPVTSPVPDSEPVKN